MHVLILNVFFTPHTYGGATIVAEEVARRLVRDHGVRVSAVSVMSRTDLVAYSVMRAEVDGIASWLINLPPQRSYLDTYRNPYVAEQLARILHEIEPDLAHVHCVQDLGADCLPALRTAGVPTILSVHDFWWLCERQFMLRPDGSFCGQSPIRIDECRGCVADFGRARTRHAYLASVAELADVVTYPSLYAKELCEASGLAPRRGVLWENGVRLPAPDFFDKQEARREKDPRTVFGFVGGPSRIKGWPIVYNTFAGLGRSDHKGLLVDGSLDGAWWRDKPIDAMAGEWSIYPRYTQDTLDDFFAEIDVLLFLSQWKETFGLTIREALSRGIRVIQTDSGGTSEHGAYAPDEMLNIGDGPAQLAPHIHAALDAPRGAPVLPVVSQSDQADAFMKIARKVLGGEETGPRKAA